MRHLTVITFPVRSGLKLAMRIFQEYPTIVKFKSDSDILKKIEEHKSVFSIQMFESHSNFYSEHLSLKITF